VLALEMYLVVNSFMQDETEVMEASFREFDEEDIVRIEDDFDRV